MYVKESKLLTEAMFGLRFPEMFPVDKLVPGNSLKAGFGVSQVKFTSGKRKRKVADLIKSFAPSILFISLRILTTGQLHLHTVGQQGM